MELAKVKRSLVPMMPVGDQDKRGLQRLLDRYDFLGRLDRAELILDSEIIDDVRERRARGGIRDKLVEFRWFPGRGQKSN